MRILLTSLLAITVLFSFSQIQETPDGLRFEFLKNVEGKVPQIGDFASLHITIKSSEGKEIRNSYEEGKPILFPVKYPHFIGDIYEAVAMMSEGDKARFWINADSMYLKVFRKPKPDFVKSGSDLEVQVEVFKIRSQKAYVNEQKNYYDKNLKEDVATIEARKKSEEIQINKYVEASGLEFEKTEKGVYYSIVDAGETEKKPKDGDAVVFHYVGELLDGTVFESSYDDIGRSITFTLGDNAIIEGWENVFPYIPMGGKAKVIIPSHLGYGNLKKGDLPANSVLIFDIQLVAIY